MEGIIKTGLISLRLKQQLIIPAPSSHLILLFLLSPLLPNLSLSFLFSSPRQLSPLSTSPSFPPSPPIHSCCLGNNTKRFSSQLCHRGNTWLSSRPLLEACRPPVRSSRLVLTTVRSRLSIPWKLLKCWWRRCRYSKMEGSCETTGDPMFWLCQGKHLGFVSSSDGLGCGDYRGVWTGMDLLSSHRNHTPSSQSQWINVHKCA